MRELDLDEAMRLVDEIADPDFVPKYFAMKAELEEYRQRYPRPSALHTEEDPCEKPAS